MKLPRIIICLPCLLLIALLTGCAPLTRSMETPDQPASTAIPTAYPTNLPTITPIFIPTAAPTNNPTAVPTLTGVQARDQLLNLLADNKSCRLPCLWDITPGKTTNLEARTILLPLSVISISTHLSGNSPDGIWMVYDKSDLRTSIELNYLFDINGVISRIAFRAEETKKIPDRFLPIYDSKTFGERLHPYMLSGILSEFGKPASVIIHSLGHPITGSGGFEILLIYPDQGIFVHYTTQIEIVGDYARGCPANAHVELELYPPGNPDAFAKSLAETDWAFAWPKLMVNPSWKSIEDVTSMSLEQFYKTFHQLTDKCIDTPTKEWYIPNQ